MECDICGQYYPPQGWTYYSVRVFDKKELIMCSDCVDHLREIKEDADGDIIGYGRCLNISKNLGPSQHIVITKDGEHRHIGDAK